MSDEVAHIVARLRLRQLWQIAAQCHPHLRPRWQHLSSFWGRLLSAATRDDREALYDLHLQAFQLSDADSALAPSNDDSALGVHDR